MRKYKAQKECELVKMSGKGQLVVPQCVRETSNLSPGERFIAYPLEDGVAFKKIKLQEDFESLSSEIEESFRKSKVTKKDVKGAIQWARKG
jgi:bifunctional DNA-binding transcriptional regulator/antitoxin component of YhaV-PrlF toxin-antitoxin module